MDSKAIELSLAELHNLHSFVEELNHTLVDVEDVISSVKRVAEGNEGMSKCSPLKFTRDDHEVESVILSVDVEYKLLQKLHYKAESLRNLIKDAQQRMKDKTYGLRQLVQKSEGWLEKFNRSGREISFSTIKDKDAMAIEKYLAVQKDVITTLLKCDLALKQ